MSMSADDKLLAAIFGGSNPVGLCLPTTPQSLTVGWFYDTEYDCGVGPFTTEAVATADSKEAGDGLPAYMLRWDADCGWV
jgi:hypothetical protein